MRSVGLFTRPSDLGAHLESHGLTHADDLPGMAVDVQALNEDIPFPAELAIEWVSGAEILNNYIEVLSPDYSRSRASLMNKGNVILSGWSQCAGC